MPHGSEKWGLKENENQILRTEISIQYSESHISREVVNKKTTREQMDVLGINEAGNGLAKINAVRLYGPVLRRDDDSVLRVA